MRHSARWARRGRLEVGGEKDSGVGNTVALFEDRKSAPAIAHEGSGNKERGEGGDGALGR